MEDSNDSHKDEVGLVTNLDHNLCQGTMQRSAVKCCFQGLIHSQDVCELGRGHTFASHNAIVLPGCLRAAHQAKYSISLLISTI
jgi:hypothetical protein